MNDGNKLYQVRKFSTIFDGPGIALNKLVTSQFEDNQDVFCHLDIEVDMKKYVKPIEVK